MSTTTDICNETIMPNGCDLITDALKRHQQQSSRNNTQRYQCRKTRIRPKLDGSLSCAAWQQTEWTQPFIDIVGDSIEGRQPPRYITRTKMLWDDEYFYVGAELQEPHIWASLTEKNSMLYWENDFEVFIDPDGKGENYYEFEINCLNTIWELTLTKPYNRGGQAIHPTNLEGLISAVKVDGTANDPSDIDKGWSVEIAFPWAGLKQFHSNSASPPSIGDFWRINFSRVQWQHKIVDGKHYARIPSENSYTEHYEDNWVWSAQGEINMHIPENWGFVQFVDPLNE